MWKLANSILALAVLAAMPACTQSPCKPLAALAAKLRAHPTAESYTQLGMYFGDRHQYACAVEAFHAALQTDPRSPRLLYLEGLNLDLAGHPAEAEDALHQAIVLAPRFSPNHLLLGSIEAERNRPEEAKREWQQALDLDPGSVSALDLLSRAEIADGDDDRAIELLRASPAAVANSEDLTLDLALAYGKAGRLDDAEALLTQSLHAHPASERLNAGLVTVLVQQTRIEQAEALARAFAAKHPRDQAARRNELEMLVLNNDDKAAEPLAASLLASSPHDAEILYLNGILERRRNDPAAARGHLEEAARLDPNRFSVHAQLGFALAALHEDHAAADEFERALALGDTDPPTRFALASSLRNLGQTERAQEQLKLYQRQLAANAAAKLASAKSAQAAEALAAKHPDEAVALYREALTAAPGDALVEYRLSVALDRSGDLAEEEQALEKAVALDPGMAIAHNQLGYLATQRGDPAAAEREFRLAVAASPAFTGAWISLAATLGIEHRLPEAREAVASALKIDPTNRSALSLRDALGAATPNP
jgi:tetratricopeptide (TPR) repeat protein